MVRSCFTLTIAARLFAQAPSPSANEVIAKTIEAMGGAAAIARVNGIKVHGRMRFGKREFTPFSVVARRPDKFRMDLTIGTDHVTQAYDGAIGWQSIDGEHRQAPTPMTGISLAHLRDQAANAIGGPLVDLEKRHNQAELIGRETVNGIDCYKLKVTLATGDTMVLFIDSSNFHEIQEEIPVEVDGKASTIQQSVGDYRRFGPILVACLFVTREKGGEDSQRLEIDSVEINPPIDDGVFKLPEK